MAMGRQMGREGGLVVSGLMSYSTIIVIMTSLSTLIVMVMLSDTRVCVEKSGTKYKD